jgi:membrane-bound lytic murein transglycosylase D
LALAAYNAGPGNVNKAIRRSGGKTTYWGVRSFLPRETQGYVPNFIAAAYLLTYHAEHNIIPMQAKLHYAQLDTMCFSGGVHMRNVANLTGWNHDEIKILNPIYKTDYIPFTVPNQCIYGPHDKISFLVSLEKELYLVENGVSIKEVLGTDEEDSGGEDDESYEISEEVSPEGFTYHSVAEGDFLGKIADQYGVTVDEIIKLNGLRTSQIAVGQLLKIKGGNTVNKPNDNGSSKIVEPAKKYYSVRSGDTFSKIAARYKISQTQLSRLNPGVNTHRIHVGQKLRVR